MGISTFVSALFNDGRVRVGSDGALSEAELRRVDELLAAIEPQYRDDLPAAPPALWMPAARHGAVALYRACQFLAFRDVDAETIRRELRRDLGAPQSPSLHYSVDLALRFLPDAARLACAKAPDDPLLAELQWLAGQWPLSSVGMSGVGRVRVEAWIDDACLRRLYVDRILARRDWPRLADDRVRAEAAGALGAFPELAPELAKVLARGEDSSLAVSLGEAQNHSPGL